MKFNFKHGMDLGDFSCVHLDNMLSNLRFLPSRGQLGSFLWTIRRSIQSNCRFFNESLTDSIISFLDSAFCSVLLKYQVNLQHKLNFCFILLVPINLCANHELSPRPAFLFQNPPKLHLSSFTCERFTDVKKVDPIFKGYKYELFKTNSLAIQFLKANFSKVGYSIVFKMFQKLS